MGIGGIPMECSHEKGGMGCNPAPLFLYNILYWEKYLFMISLWRLPALSSLDTHRLP